MKWFKQKEGTGRTLYFSTVPGKPIHRALTETHACTMPDGTTEEIPIDWTWDGSSIFWLIARVFPRWRHPIASCEHDYGCAKAKNKEERKFHDEKFQVTVGNTSWWITKKFGFFGVRIGSFFGIGNHFEENNGYIEENQDIETG
jgi:hypothetical protein